MGTPEMQIGIPSNLLMTYVMYCAGRLAGCLAADDFIYVPHIVTSSWTLRCQLGIIWPDQWATH